MKNSECIFCKIIEGAVPAKVVTEDTDVLVIEDIAPKAPIHYLIIPKKHIQDITSLDSADAGVLAKLFFKAQALGHDVGDFRILVNNGSGAGQSVPHLHLHFLAGKKMTDF